MLNEERNERRALALARNNLMEQLQEEKEKVQKERRLVKNLNHELLCLGEELFLTRRMFPIASGEKPLTSSESQKRLGEDMVISYLTRLDVEESTMDIFEDGTIYLTVTIEKCKTVKKCFLHTLSMRKYCCWDGSGSSWRADRVAKKLDLGKLHVTKHGQVRNLPYGLDVLLRRNFMDTLTFRSFVKFGNLRQTLGS